VALFYPIGYFLEFGDGEGVGFYFHLRPLLLCFG
jgi:hypothetical protein